MDIFFRGVIQLPEITIQTLTPQTDNKLVLDYRQTSPPGGTVQLLESAHIQKTPALKVSLLLILSTCA